MCKKRFQITMSIMAILVVFSVQVVMAADQPLPELKVEELTVTAYDELFLMDVTGMIHSLRLDGKVFLAVHTVVLPQWTEDIKRFKIDAKEILLAAPDGTEIPTIGYFNRVGQFSVSTKHLNASRRSNWQENPQKLYYNAVFAIPKDGQTYQLKLGTLALDVEKPAEIEQSPEHGSMVNVEILGSRLVDQVKSIHKAGEEKVETTVSNPNGRLLEVQIQLTPLRQNNYRPGSFFWHTSWFWALCDNGCYTQTIAEHFMERFSDNVSHNPSYRSDGTWGTGKATLYFPVPENTKSFTLIYITSPVAEGTIE